MKNKTLEEIVDFVSAKLTANFGYCGVANGDNFSMLNTEDGAGNDIKITIKLDKDT